jgi:hypothetical protein
MMDKTPGRLKSGELKHRVTACLSFTEKVKLGINAFCVALFLHIPACRQVRVENIFEITPVRFIFSVSTSNLLHVENHA